MPYRRRYPKRKFPRAYGTQYRSTRKFAGMYTTPRRTVYPKGISRRFGRHLRSVIRSLAEHKYFDYILHINGTGLYWPDSTTGYIASITDVTQGTSDITRIGDKCTGTSLEYNLGIFPDLITGNLQGANWIMRVTIFVWKDDTAPVIGDIYDQTVLAVGNAQYLFCPFDHDKSVKRKILFDRTYSTYCYFQAVGVNTAYAPFIRDKQIIPLTGLRKGLSTINYQGVSTTGVNKIYICVISNVLAAQQAATAFANEIHIRYNFTDV